MVVTLNGQLGAHAPLNAVQESNLDLELAPIQNHNTVEMIVSNRNSDQMRNQLHARSNRVLSTA